MEMYSFDPGLFIWGGVWVVMLGLIFLALLLIFKEVVLI